MTESEHTSPTVFPLTDGWTFLPGRASSAWLSGQGGPVGVPVRLPHTWNDRDTFQQDVDYRRGFGSYRCRFFFGPETTGNDSPSWWLRSDGFYGTGELWLNGRRHARFDAQYMGLSIDVTECLSCSELVLGIRVTNRCAAHILPGIGMPDFVLYGGLAGRVWLEQIPSLSVERDETVVTTEFVGETGADLGFSTFVCNRSDRARPVRVFWTVINRRGLNCTTRLSLPKNVAPGQRVRFAEESCFIPDVERWQLDDPALYTLQIQLLEEEQTRDQYAVSFGCREVRIEGGRGCILNGEHVLLQGCNRHESIPGLGNAMSPGLHREDAEILKRFGCNFVRLSHYPQHPAFLDACDALGILVYAEIATWKSVRGGRWLRNACRQMEAMIRRDRNHPSVFIWGLGNESRERGPYTRLMNVVRRLDSERQTIYAENHLHRGRRKHTLALPDVLGVNYELDKLDEAIEASCNGAVLVSECSSYPTRRGEVAAERTQLATLELDRKRVLARPSATGYAAWCFCDYATLRKKRYTRFSGIFDSWRLPKLAAWRMRAAAASEPFVKLIGDWSIGSGDGMRSVSIFTNTKRVTLTQGGDPVYETEEKEYDEVDLLFQAEPLIATVDGSKSVVDQLLPWGEATRLVFCSGKNKWASNEIAWLDVLAADASGHPVLDFHGILGISANGPCRVCSHLPVDEIELCSGIGRVYLRGDGVPGDAEISATHPELCSAACTIVFR